MAQRTSRKTRGSEWNINSLRLDSGIGYDDHREGTMASYYARFSIFCGELRTKQDEHRKGKRRVNHCFFHLARAAACAICFLCSFDNRAALAFPPFNPPSLPSATAAGFFSGFAGSGWLGACPVARCMMLKAVSFMSLLE